MNIGFGVARFSHASHQL